MRAFTECRTAIDEGRALFAVIGIGYVGLPHSLTFCRAGLRVLGLAVDPDKGAILNHGKSHLQPAGNKFIELAGEVHTRMPKYVVGKVKAGLGNKTCASPTS